MSGTTPRRDTIALLPVILAKPDFYNMYLTGYPLHRENRVNGKKESLSGKTQGIWKFCQNTGKTQGVWFAQVVNFPILKVKRYFYICRRHSLFFKAGYVYQVSLVYVIVTNHVNWHRENLQSDREKTGKTQGI